MQEPVSLGHHAHDVQNRGKDRGQAAHLVKATPGNCSVSLIVLPLHGSLQCMHHEQDERLVETF